MGEEQLELGLEQTYHSYFVLTFPKFRALRHLGKVGMGLLLKRLRQQGFKQSLLLRLPNGPYSPFGDDGRAALRGSNLQAMFGALAQEVACRFDRGGERVFRADLSRRSSGALLQKGRLGGEFIFISGQDAPCV
jgi:hypothetical protein